MFLASTQSPTGRLILTVIFVGTNVDAILQDALEITGEEEYFAGTEQTKRSTYTVGVVTNTGRVYSVLRRGLRSF